MNETTPAPFPSSLSPDELSALERRVDEMGLPAFAARCGSSVSTITRLLARRPVRPGSVVLVRMALEASR